MWRPICPSPATSSQGFFGRASGQRRPGAESGILPTGPPPEGMAHRVDAREREPTVVAGSFVPRRGRTATSWMHTAGSGSASRTVRAPAGQTLRWAAKCPAGHPNVPEIRGVTDIEQDSCCGPDPDVWHHGCAIHRSDIMFIIGHFRSSLESPDRGRGARRDRPGTTDAGTRLTRRPAPGCGTATRFTALSWLCGRAGEPSVQFSTATDRPDRTGRGWAG